MHVAEGDKYECTSDQELPDAAAYAPADASCATTKLQCFYA